MLDVIIDFLNSIEQNTNKLPTWFLISSYVLTGIHCIIAVLAIRYYNGDNENTDPSSGGNIMSKTEQTEKNAISELSSHGYQEVAAELSKMTSEQAEIVISNSNIKLFMKK